MATKLLWVVAAAPALLAACTPISIVPQQPKLAAMRLYGNEVCGAFTTPYKTLQFSNPCAPLPTSEDSGWLLTPLYLAPDEDHLNRVVTFNITGPSLTDLDIEYLYSNTFHKSPTQTKAPVGAARQSVPIVPTALGSGVIWVDATDDGTTKTWNVTTALNTCYDSVEFKFTTTAAGAAPSKPLNLAFLRNPSEKYCAGSSVASGQGAYVPCSPGTANDPCHPSRLYGVSP